MYISLASISEENDQLDQNMQTLAHYIIEQNTFGLDLRYVLEHDVGGEALSLLKQKLGKLKKVSNLNIDELLSHIGSPHISDDVIEIKLESLESIESDRLIPDREYVVALEGDSPETGMSIPNYTTAATIGLSLAALRVCRDEKGTQPSGKREYEMFRKDVLDKFKIMFKRYGIIENKNDFSEDELELMVTGSSATKLYYTLRYALPPIVKVVEGINEYHEIIRGIWCAV